MMSARKKRRLGWYDREFTPTDPRLWLYGPVPPGFWKSSENRHLYMDWLGQQLGLAELEDWYRVTFKDFVKHRGAYLWAYFGRSLLALLKDYRPQYDWLEWRFSQVSARFWAVGAHRQRYLDWLGRQLGFRRIEDWYQISERDFTQWYGWGLLAHFGGSPIAILKDYRADYQWLEWHFRHVPLSFWHKRANRRRYLLWLGQQLGFQDREDWYQLSKQHLLERHGSRLLAQFGSSPCAIVQDAWPQYRWLEWRFRQVRQGFWDDPANRHRYMGWLGKQLGFRRLEDWYQLSKQPMTEYYGGGLLAQFSDSPSAVLKDYRSDYEWKEWLFSRPPQGFWTQSDNRRRYLDWLGQQLGFQRPEDWSRLRYVEVTTHRGYGLLKHFQHRVSLIVKEYLSLTTRSVKH
jgi:hypothetical protein